ncbi:hypothetical protein Salat_2660400 [Sesamum alatum]|uniref:PB1-like domain-containing protein n=1 Tax=Sesamum alatum TaxID=300844 RepID=A0AAE1XPA6_9LAMI|nr:hypothetical protein Salat_2660400 [Sesamum alatum]
MPDPLDPAVTMKIHHGGQFCNVPPAYVGSTVSVFDHIELNYVDIPYFDRLYEKIGYKGLTKYYKLDGCFVLLSSGQEILDLCLEHELDREVHVYLEGEIGGEVESNEEPLELNERNDDSRDSEDFLDSDYDLGSEDGEGENNGVDEDDELFTRHVDEEVEWEGGEQSARKRTITSTRRITQDSDVPQNTNPGKKSKAIPKAGPKKPTWQDLTLRRSTRLNAPVTGGEGGMNSMPIPAAFKPPRPAPVPTPTQTPVPRCVVRPPVPFAPGHPNVAISITTKQNKPLPPPFKIFQKDGKKYVTMNNLTAALNVRRAEKCSKGQGTKNTYTDFVFQSVVCMAKNTLLGMSHL